MAGDVPVWPDNMALMTVKGGCLQACLKIRFWNLQTVAKATVSEHPYHTISRQIFMLHLQRNYYFFALKYPHALT